VIAAVGLYCHYVPFKAPSGEQSQAQIEAFEDTWHWNDSAEKAFDEVVTGPHHITLRRFTNT